MADLQRQIGDHARAAAGSTVREQTEAEIAREEARADGSCSNARCRLGYAHSGPCDQRAQTETSPRSTVGDVIQPGQPIPDDVLRFRTSDDEIAYRDEAGERPWRLVGCENPGTCSTHSASEFEWPLTVTAVREQPAEPVEGFPGRTLREQREAYEASANLDTPVLVFRSASGRTEVAHRAEGFSIHVLHGSDRLTADEARQLAAKLAPAEPEPQQADEPALLDLVRQYGEESYQQGIAAGQRDEGGEDHYDDKARALLVRIAALVPQQPAQARDGNGDPWWIHTCGQTDLGEGDVPPAHPCGKPGPWRPLLAGGDPAPEQPDLIAFVMAELGVDQRAFVLPMLKNRLQAVEIAEGQRDEARAEIERLNRVLRVVADPASASGTTPTPDPQVLRLPEVPEGTVALTGSIGLGELLDREGGATPELAPPREPRTWPKLDPAELAGAPARVKVGSLYFRRLTDAGTYRSESSGGLWGWWSLRGGGDVTEVLDDEPGGAR